MTEQLDHRKKFAEPVDARVRRPTASAVTITYSGAEEAPMKELLRLEATLRCLFPAACDVLVRVEVSWYAAYPGWLLHTARALFPEGSIIDITYTLALSCLAAGVPVVMDTEGAAESGSR